MPTGPSFGRSIFSERSEAIRSATEDSGDRDFRGDSFLP
jgi:hypothetical protein